MLLSLWLGLKEGLVLKSESERRHRAKTQSGQCDEKEVATPNDFCRYLFAR